MLDFKNRYNLERWLKGEAREVAIVIAARSALRAVPALGTALPPGGVREAGTARNALVTAFRGGAGAIILPIFRGMAAPWATVGYPAHGAAIRPAAVDAAQALDTADLNGPHPVVDAAISAAISAVAYAAAAATEEGSILTYAADDGYAGTAAAYAAHAVDAAAAAATGDAAAAATGDAVVAAAGDAVVAAAAGDADEIDAGLRAGGHASAVAAALALRPLWPDGEPEWASEGWGRFKRALLVSGENDWEVWTDWYEARLRGGPANEALEVARVMIPHKIWYRDPAAVNAHIRELIAQHSPETPVSEEKKEEPEEAQPSIEAVPSQGPGPRYRANEEGRIDRAPVGDIDERGNDIKTINQLRPLVLRCAAELQTRLSLNQFPELVASVQSYRGALEPGGDRPIEWGEVWGLGVLLQNAAASAEREIRDRILPERLIPCGHFAAV